MEVTVSITTSSTLHYYRIIPAVGRSLPTNCPSGQVHCQSPQSWVQHPPRRPWPFSAPHAAASMSGLASSGLKQVGDSGNEEEGDKTIEWKPRPLIIIPLMIRQIKQTKPCLLSQGCSWDTGSGKTSYLPSASACSKGTSHCQWQQVARAQNQCQLRLWEVQCGSWLPWWASWCSRSLWYCRPCQPGPGRAKHPATSKTKSKLKT